MLLYLGRRVRGDDKGPLIQFLFSLYINVYMFGQAPFYSLVDTAINLCSLLPVTPKGLSWE